MGTEPSESSNAGILGWISDFFDRLNYSHPWNRETFETISGQLAKHAEFTANIQLQSLLGYRNNLLALVGGLVALIGLLVNYGLDKGALSFKVGFTALLLSVAFAVIQAIVVASYDIGGLQRSLEKTMAFKNAVGKHLSEVKKFEFSSKRKKEFEKAVKEYADYIAASKKSWITRFSRIVAICLNASLVVSMGGFVVYYGSIVWG